MHFAGRFEKSALSAHPVYESHSQGYTHASLVNHATGSVHTGLSMNQLAAQGTLSPHVHSYEEGFYILEGQALMSVNDQAYLLEPGDFGAFKVGTPHAWRNAGTSHVRWLQMAAPQPKPHGQERDTFFPKNGRIPHGGETARYERSERQSARPFRRGPDPSGGAKARGYRGIEGRVSQLDDRREVRRAPSPHVVHRVSARRGHSAA